MQDALGIAQGVLLLASAYASALVVSASAIGAWRHAVPYALLMPQFLLLQSPTISAQDVAGAALLSLVAHCWGLLEGRRPRKGL